MDSSKKCNDSSVTMAYSDGEGKARTEIEFKTHDVRLNIECNKAD